MLVVFSNIYKGRRQKKVFSFTEISGTVLILRQTHSHSLQSYFQFREEIFIEEKGNVHFSNTGMEKYEGVLKRKTKKAHFFSDISDHI